MACAGCPPPQPSCGRDADTPCLLGEPGGDTIRVDVAANVWGLKRGQCAVWVTGDAVPTLLGVYLIAT